MARVDYRKFLKDFSITTIRRNYWATELMFKHAEEELCPISPPFEVRLPSCSSNFFIVPCYLKIGREYVDIRYFRVFDFYVDLGIMACNNYIGFLRQIMINHSLLQVSFVELLEIQ